MIADKTTDNGSQAVQALQQAVRLCQQAQDLLTDTTGLRHEVAAVHRATRVVDGVTNRLGLTLATRQRMTR